MAQSAATETILITGAGGLLGARVMELFSHATTARIIATTRRTSQTASHPNIQVVHGDLRHAEVWQRLPDSITCVIHLAAVIPRAAEAKSQSSVVTDNVLPIANLIQHSERWPNLRQIIYSSSVSVYGQSTEWLKECSPTQPTSLYGAAKLCGEELMATLKTRNVSVVSLRLSSLYGRGQYEGTVLPIMIKRARQKQNLLVFGDGSRTQDFVHCEDAAHAIELAFRGGARGVYNIGSGIPITMSELAQTVRRVFADSSLEIILQPEKIDSDAGIKLDIAKAKRELNYEPAFRLEAALQILKQELTHG